LSQELHISDTSTLQRT